MIKIFTGFLKNKKTLNRKKYLFVGGVGRSGTSSLTEIIGSHPQIVLGMERYNSLFAPKNFSVSPALFEKERFLSIRPGDTFYTDFKRFRPHQNIAEKWDMAVYVGVKYPRIATVYNLTKEALGNFKLIYIYRNIFDVTESWNRRLIEKPNWPRHRDYKKAVSFWNNSLRKTRKLIREKGDIACIRYEDLFFSEASLQPLFDWLELKLDNNVAELLNQKRALAPEKKAKKGNLPAKQREYIAENARFDIYEEFNSKYNILV